MTYVNSVRVLYSITLHPYLCYLNTIKTPWFFFVALTLLVGACKHDPEPIIDIPPIIDNPPYVDSGCSSDTAYFTNTILPLITMRCAMSGCHDTPTDVNDGIVLTTYEQIRLYVQPGSLDESRLWDSAIGETEEDDIMPPPYATPLSDAEKASISKWIEQGALNNSCNDCDTTFAFAADILPIIQSNCIGCHSGNPPQAGLVLVSYSDIQAAVTSNGLLDRINDPVNPMPPNNQLNDCLKNQIQSWVDADMPNN